MFTILFILALIGIFNAIDEIINNYKRKQFRKKMIENFENKHKHYKN